MKKSRSRTSRRRSLPENSESVVYRALKQAGLPEYADRMLIFQCWQEVVGAKIAARTTPDVFRNGVLFVKVATPTWQQELSYLKGDIVAKLNKALGKAMVQDLRIICGTRPNVRNASHEVKRQLHPAPEDCATASATAASISCTTVRAAFESLMAKDLCSKRQR